MRGKRARRSLQNPRQRAEALEQAARQRFHVAAGNGLHQEEFNDLMIRQSLVPALNQPPSKARAMTGRIVAARLGAFSRGLVMRHSVAGIGAAFIEEWGLVWHILHKQLPFRHGQRK
ncbi:molybdenum ABC transporter, periplasmic molybdat e-binding protein [Novosphingobium sp. PY1]|nr:molybdenum ABC transporter, periplasmic molybdat e-binding protein [Novosphingobium sp. PY1]